MKFHIIDEDGKRFEVEELENKEVEEVKDEDEEVMEHVELTTDEIAALKKLAAVADKLIGLTDVHDKDEMHEDLEDEDEVHYEEKEDEEEVIDTDEDMKGCRDSKSSATSTERRKASFDDSFTVNEIDDAWSKRYNGGNK